MFKKLFGNPKGDNGATVSSTTTNRTVDAIQKLSEVGMGAGVAWRGPVLRGGRGRPHRLGSRPAAFAALARRRRSCW